MNISQTFAWKKESTRKNNPLLPNNIRGLLIGSSNCGKTTLLLNLLLQPGWLDYNHLYIFGRSLHQREYTILKKGLDNNLSKEQIANIFRNQDDINSPVELIQEYIDSGGETKGGIVGTFYNDCKLIPDPSELNSEDKNLMVFDDCLLEKENKANLYYTRGRHSNVDTFLLSQSYFRLDRQTVRENSNIIFLFPQNDKNLDHIYRDHCTSITLNEFKDYCKKVWEKKYNFVTLDLTRTGPGRFRENLDTFMDPRLAEEYETVMRKIRQRNEAERTGSILKEEENIETYKPIVAATEEQTKVLREGLKNYEKLTPGMDALDFYLNQYKGTVDPYFSIKNIDGLYFLGDKEVFIQDNAIYVDHEIFRGSTGLWALIMENTPDMKNISTDEIDEYTNLMQLTNAYEVGMKNPNAKLTEKAKLLRHLKFGEGISFLPSDINSLEKRLKILLGEFNAGNGATRPEIIAITDNLLQRKRMTKKEVKEISEHVSYTP